MTMQEAIALQPAWVGYWLSVLFFCAFILPAALLIWKQTRLTSVFAIISSVTGGFATAKLYDAVGYVKLLGLPHIIFWTPLAIYLIVQLRRPDIPKLPRTIMMVILGAITISLVFDYMDLFRYLLGDRTPVEGTV